MKKRNMEIIAAESSYPFCVCTRVSVRVREEGPAAWPVNPRDPTVSTSVLGLPVGTTSLLYLASGDWTHAALH